MNSKGKIAESIAVENAGSTPQADTFSLKALLPFAVLFILAFGLRVLYLTQIREIPFFETLVGDAASYDSWAQTLTAGDWWGKEAFYQAPAYPYFLGIVYSVIGRDMFTIRLVQCLLGAAACVLLGLAGRRFFSDRVGYVAAFLLAVYPPAIFFDGLIQKTSLGLFFMTLLLWQMGQLQYRVRTYKWFLLGITLGLIGLTRENTLVFILVVFGWLWVWFRSRSISSRAIWSGAVVCGLIVTLGFVAYRNHAVGGAWAITTVQSGPNFYIGNNQDATGRYTPLVRGHESPPFEQGDARQLAEEATGRKMSDSEVSQYWLDKSLAFIRNHPGRWLALLAKKTLLTFNRYEITDTEGYSVYKLYSPLLVVFDLLLHFGVVVPLAITGIVLCRQQWRSFGLVCVLAAAFAASVILFYVFARYRFPLVPLLLIPAAACLCRLYEAYRQKLYKPILAGFMIIALTSVITNWKINPEQQLDGMAYANLGAVLAQRNQPGDIAAAARVFEISLSVNPDSPEVHYNLGLANRILGKPQDAARHLESARMLDPTLVEVDFQLGQIYEGQGSREKAMECYARALRRNPNDRQAAAALKRLER